MTGGLAQGAAPECARDGQALIRATDDFSVKVLERRTARHLGPDVARILHNIPWKLVWVGDPRLSQSSYFIQGFEEHFRLPNLKFAIAAPAPLKVELALEMETDARPCVPIDVAGDLSAEMRPTEGTLALHAPMKVVVTMSVGGLKDRWVLPSEEAVLGWAQEGAEQAVWLDAAGLTFGLRAPHASGSVSVTMKALRHNPDIERWKALLVNSLGVPGSHRDKSVSLLRDLGFRELSGDLWIRVRALQDARHLRASEEKRLAWLTRRVEPTTDDQATVFSFSAPPSKPPPRLFVAGREYAHWVGVGEGRAIRVPLSGLAPVRVEFSDGSILAFLTVFGSGVRIRLLDVGWGPILEGSPPGLRCGLVRDKASAPCGARDEPAPVAKMFDLLRTCGGIPAASGSAIEFGLPLVASMPGLYVRDRRREIVFDPTYGGQAGAPSSCRTATAAAVR